MAVNRVPVLKRCRSLGLDPIYLGIDKKSTRQLKRANRKMSEYGLQLREKQKAKFIYGVLEKPFRNYYKKADRMPGQTGENLMIMLETRLDNVIFRMGKAKFIYGVLEKPFRNYYKKADRMPGQTGENLMIMLETRLDNVIFRMGFARTRREARQIVDHKHVLVNGKCVNIPSYLVKAGDTVEIKEKCKGSEFARTRREARQIVDHKHVLVNGKCVNIPSYLVKAGDTVEIKEKCKGSERYKGILEVTGGRLVPEWLDVNQDALSGTVKELPNREVIDVPVDEMLIVELYSK